MDLVVFEKVNNGYEASSIRGRVRKKIPQVNCRNRGLMHNLGWG